MIFMIFLSRQVAAEPTKAIFLPFAIRDGAFTIDLPRPPDVSITTNSIMENAQMMMRFCLLVAALSISTPLFAKSLVIAGDNYNYVASADAFDSGAVDGWDFYLPTTQRVRVPIGGGWQDGAAELKLVIDLTQEGADWSQAMRVGIASSPNDDFVRAEMYYEEVVMCGVRCVTYFEPRGDMFLSNTLEEVVSTPWSTRATPVRDPAHEIWTLNYTALLQSDTDYFMFIEFSGVKTTPMPFTITLSQVPVPAAAWLFGSGLLGLAVAGRRRMRNA
jgi:hypothetical protein